MSKWTLILWLGFAGGLAAQSPQPPEARSSPADIDSRPEQGADDDSVDSWIRRGMLDRAEAFARQQMDAMELSTDEAAKWAVVLSNVRLAKLLRAPLAEQQGFLDAATEPLDRLLVAYPEHRRSAWLRFQRSVAEVVVARQRGAVVLATPGDEPLRLGVLATWIQATRTLQGLEAEVAEEIAAAFDRRDRTSWIDELMSLRNAIAIKRVEVLLRRGELFANDSDDFLAAAGQAQQAAVDALALVRQDPLRQAELLRMRCEALLRMGQGDRAAELLRPLLSGDSESETRRLDDATLALAVRIALELGQRQQAAEMLAAHYGDQPADAPAAPESDLARLRFLITLADHDGDDAQEHERRIGDWIEAVRQRGGEFAQRRAETIAVELLAARSDAATDDRIVIAEAAAKLRQGQPLAAAEMLDIAARRSADAATARRLAIAGAAAYGQAEQDLQAVKLLRQTAETHAQYRQSADLFLQAAVLYERIDRAKPTRTGEPVPGEAVNELLRQTIVRWPREQAALQARRWLVARLLAAGKPVEAAIAASPTGNETATDQQWEEAAQLWIDALAAVPLLNTDFSANSASQQLTIQALEHLRADSSAARRSRKRVIALFATAGDVADAQRDADDEPLIGWLLSVRRGGEVGPPPDEEVSSTIRHAALQRLMADGIAAPPQRSQLAAAILQLSEHQPSLARAQALIWLRDWQAADEVLDQWVVDQLAGQGHAAAVMAAQLLAQSPHRSAKEKAFQRYAAVGAQLVQGSPSWHRVKLATIELMNDLGQKEEASQLARYILLTRPPEGEATHASYRRWLQR